MGEDAERGNVRWAGSRKGPRELCTVARLCWVRAESTCMVVPREIVRALTISVGTHRTTGFGTGTVAKLRWGAGGGAGDRRWAAAAPRKRPRFPSHRARPIGPPA